MKYKNFVIWILLCFFAWGCAQGENASYQNHIDRLYNEVKSTLNPNNPGYGKSDYGDFDVVDIPKSYAMFLSAELMKYKANHTEYDLSMAIKAGNWLLDNSALSQDKVVGWGVPVAWDAFGDNSINEKNTAYTISTGIVINSLLDWLELSPESAPKDKIIKIISKAIYPYLHNEILSNSGLFNYSLKQNDRKYNTFNAAIYMAGQMQRFSRFIDDENIKNKIYVAVDRVMSAAIQYKKIDINGGWYWPYSLEEFNTPNDLTHAGYVIDGIYNYIRNNGTLKNNIDEQAVLKHLDLFSNEDGTQWYFYPSNFKDKPISPRLYGVGFTLYLLSKYTNNQKKILNLINFAQGYRVGNSYSRWKGEDIGITEYLTYFMYGLSSVAAQEHIKNKIFLHSNEHHTKKITLLLKNTSFHDGSEIPLTNFKVDGLTFYFSTSQKTTTAAIGNKKIAFDKFHSIPIKALETNEYYVVLFRELLSNHLLAAKIDKKTGDYNYTKIDNNTDSFLDFRNAIILNDELIVVAYESTKGKNSILSFSIYDDFKRTYYAELPSLEDPAGKTCEVIPNIFLIRDKQDDNTLNIIGGRAYFQYTNGKVTSKQVKNHNITVFYEAVISNKNELFTIAKNNDTSFSVYNLSNNSIVFQGNKGQVLFGLDYYRDSVQYRTLESTNDLVELFVNDFTNNKGAGSLYLGTNNIEGWSAWAQVYYLNGLLSFLELARNDIDFFNVFKHYVAPVKKRLDLEMKLLTEQYKSSDSLSVRVFSVDRSLSTFAVQSSRFALLYRRYLKISDDPFILSSFQSLKQEALSLKNHMETLHSGTSKIVSNGWNRDVDFYLAWPKGNKFYFDGLPVPYNHQNEWATFVLGTEKHKIGASIINLFVGHITHHRKNKHLPKNAIWPYWWGIAWDGYTEKDDISVNTPSYQGDKANGWISFRSIDAIAMLKLFKLKKEYTYIDDIDKFVKDGYLYPFASKELVEINQVPLLNNSTIANYIRFSSPWELDNSTWAYLSFIKRNLSNTID